MKKALPFLIICLFTMSAYAQDSLGTSPMLTIGTPGFSQGTINTSVLQSVIQEKQQEVETQVFHNIVVKSFNKASFTKDFRNFTTYHFMYQVMEELVSGKNSQIMMQNITEDFAEFAYVYGFMIYLHELIETAHTNQQDTFFLDNKYVKEAKANGSLTGNGKQMKLEIAEDSVLYRFNLLIDLTYDLLLTDTSLRGEFTFDVDTTNQVFMSWYLADNVYRQAVAVNPNSTELSTLRTNVTKQLQHFSNIDTSLTNVGAFYKGLKKSNFTDFTLTQAQYNSLRYIMNEFIKQVENHTQNNIVAEVCQYLLDHTLISYNVNGDRYLSIDVESVISTVSDNFLDIGNKGLGVYLVPFFSIGANQAYFVDNNQLGPADAAGSPTNLDNLYFASEKIGFKYKIWNWGYTHSFKQGINYKYYGKNYAWVRPHATPTISDLHVMVYGSGLLYNLANLKSEDSFNYGLVGAGVGLTFFNKLSLHGGLGMPFTNKQFKRDNLFITFGFDIPISEYISALSRN
ncbi:MAG: hypothetical protein ACPGJS_06095 [Flammeovirgaceae bacterium]